MTAPNDGRLTFGETGTKNAIGVSSGPILDYRRGWFEIRCEIVRAMVGIRHAAAQALRSFDPVRRREEGQALVEYALVLFLVALVTIAILGTMGTAVSSMLSVVNAEF